MSEDTEWGAEEPMGDSNPERDRVSDTGSRFRRRRSSDPDPLRRNPDDGNHGAHAAGPPGSTERGEREDAYASSGDIHNAASIRAGIANIVGQALERLTRARRPVVRSREPTDADIERLARLSTERDIEGAHKVVLDLLGSGATVGWVLNRLVPAAARHLGDQWDLDEWSFVEVTWGIGTLQLLIRRLSEDAARSARLSELVVLTSPPAEQHTLGLFVLGESLRREGWAVDVAPSLTDDELVDKVATEPIVAVGVSISNTDLFEPLRPLFDRLRKASLRPKLSILLGGTPELHDKADEVGAIFLSDSKAASDWLNANVSRDDSGGGEPEGGPAPRAGGSRSSQEPGFESARVAQNETARNETARNETAQNETAQNEAARGSASFEEAARERARQGAMRSRPAHRSHPAE